jgi:pyruvate ferredoxin oxidoreductase alpha subunit
MSKTQGIEVSIAAAEAVALANVDVVAAYPITPQTHVVEHLSEIVAQGRLDAEYIPVESEHSAISACVGAAAAGGRTFTSTASQGLALMHEILFLASTLRLPIVMVVANRTLSAPINIWADHSDVMPERDTGWVQLFAENGQDVFDMTLQSFKLAEDHRVLLPVMINMDGFTLSHVIEPISMMTQDEADAFLPPFKPARMLDPKNPRTIGGAALGPQNIVTEVRQQVEAALKRSETVLDEIWAEFGNRFGRHYRPVEAYETEDAEVILVTMGSVGETALTAVREMRAEGQKVGLASLRLWRPFPFDRFFQAVRNAKVIAVLDRALTFGAQGGPVATEIRSAFYHRQDAPVILDFVGGLGGEEITRETFRDIVYRSAVTNQPAEYYTFLDARIP